MTEFQVGDRVSVEGVVTQGLDTGAYVKIGYPQPIHHFFPTDALTLIERPKRKLRVGSVWEHNFFGKKAYMVGHRAGVDLFVPLDGLGVALLRTQTNFDTHPQDWREVPVEELEREAQA